MIKKKENEGRNKLYTDEMLIDIIGKYLAKNPHVDKLVPSKIAEFAREELGLIKIRYSHFTNNKEVKDKIDKFNEEYNKIVLPNKLLYIIREYLAKNPHVDKLVPSEIAEFAREELGLIKIRYSHFTNNKEVKDKIDKFNEEYNKIVMSSKSTDRKFASINTDALID